MKNVILVITCALVGGPLVSALQAQDVVTVEFVMANNDLNKDGIITKEEATKAARTLAQVWDLFDANMDGKVDAEEIKKGLLAAQGTVPPPAVDPR